MDSTTLVIPTPDPPVASVAPCRHALGRPLIVLALLGALGIFFHAGYYAWWGFDDAFISMRYAEHLARHGVLEYNLGERVEGFSNLLWTLQLALAARLGLPIFPVARLLGLFSTIGLFWLGLALFRALARQVTAARLPQWLGAVLITVAFVCSSPLAAHSEAGLETTQYALLLDGAVVAGCLAALLERRRLLASASAAFSLAILSRPEAFCYYPFFLAAPALAANRPRDFLRRHRLALAMPLAVLAGLVAWRLAYFGAPLPLTVTAKSALNVRTFQGLTDVALFFTFGAPGWLYLFLAPLALAPLLPALRLFPVAVIRALAALALLVLANILFVIKVGGDVLILSRFLVPSILPLNVLLALALTAYVARWRVPQGRWPRRTARIAACVLIAAAGRLFWGQACSFLHGVDYYYRVVMACDKVDFWAQATRHFLGGDALKASPYYNVYGGLVMPLIPNQWLPGQSAVIGDIGLTGMLADSVRILDVNGLVTPAFAHLVHDQADSRRREQRKEELFHYLDRVQPEWFMVVNHYKRPEIFPGIAFDEWSGASAYEHVMTYWDWGENLLAAWPCRHLEILRRRDAPLPDAGAVRRNYARLARLFPHSSEVQAICRNQAATADVELPHRVYALNPDNPVGNRIRVRGATLVGQHFLGSFERNAEGWRLEGAAMAGQPVHLAGGDKQPVQGFAGRALIDTSRGKPAVNTAEQGVATSEVFYPKKGDRLFFFISGGCGPDTGVALLADGREWRRWHGVNSVLLRSVLVDLTPLAGRAVRIQVIDHSSAPWGFVQADHFLIMRAAP